MEQSAQLCPGRTGLQAWGEGVIHAHRSRCPRARSNAHEIVGRNHPSFPSHPPPAGLLPLEAPTTHPFPHGAIVSQDSPFPRLRGIDRHSLLDAQVWTYLSPGSPAAVPSHRRRLLSSPHCAKNLRVEHQAGACKLPKESVRWSPTAWSMQGGRCSSYRRKRRWPWFTAPLRPVLRIVTPATLVHPCTSHVASPLLPTRVV